MNKDNFDAETNKEVAEAEALEAMFRSSGWQIAERELNDMIGALRDITTMDENDQNIAINLAVRKKTAMALEEWIDLLKSQINNVIIMKDEDNSSKLIERR